MMALLGLEAGREVGEALGWLAELRLGEGRMDPGDVAERLLADGDMGAKIATSHDDIQLVVAGGAGRHSAIIPSFGNTKAVTEVFVLI